MKNSGTASEEDIFWLKTAGDRMHAGIRPPLKNGVIPLKISHPTE